jgi:hypothetical protein
MSSNDENEEFYWLQLLGDLGTSRGVETSNDANYFSGYQEQATDQFYYLNKLENNKQSDENSNIWLLGKEVLSSEPIFDHSKNENDLSETTKTGEKELNYEEAETEGQKLIQDKIFQLQDDNSGAMKSLDKIWSTEYPKALELLRSEMLFHKLDFDLESVNENEDDTGFEIVDYNLDKPLPASSSDLFIVQVPDERSLSSQLRNLKLHFFHLNLRNLSNYLPPMENIKHSFGFFLQVALKNLQTAKSNALVSSFLGTITESSIYLSDKAQNLIPLINSSPIPLSDDGLSTGSSRKVSTKSNEEKYLEKLTKSIGWENISLRYCMGSIAFKERQLLKETRDDTKNIVTSFKQFKEQLKDLYSSNSSPSSSAIGKTQQMKQTNPESTLPDQGADPNDGKFYDSLCQAILSSPRNNEKTLEDSQNDGEAMQEILQKYFTPPKPQNHQTSCQKCGLIFSNFSVANFRYSCSYCGNCFCDAHSSQRRKIFRYGLISPVRVCRNCCSVLDEIHRRERLMWKDHRTMAYLNGDLIHYSNISEEELQIAASSR